MDTALAGCSCVATATPAALNAMSDPKTAVTAILVVNFIEEVLPSCRYENGLYGLHS
jgi:hypothetical protein